MSLAREMIVKKIEAASGKLVALEAELLSARNVGAEGTPKYAESKDRYVALKAERAAAMSELAQHDAAEKAKP